MTERYRLIFADGETVLVVGESHPLWAIESLIERHGSLNLCVKLPERTTR